LKSYEPSTSWERVDKTQRALESKKRRVRARLSDRASEREQEGEAKRRRGRDGVAERVRIPIGSLSLTIPQKEVKKNLACGAIYLQKVNTRRLENTMTKILPMAL